MKETKVYVDELPKSCSECVCVYDCYCGITQKNIYYEFYEWTKPKDCPLIDIKTHDRELVKEVCEKIRDMAHKVGKLVFCEYCYATNSARAIDEHLLNEILGQTESEFKQKEIEKC